MNENPSHFLTQCYELILFFLLLFTSYEMCHLQITIQGTCNGHHIITRTETVHEYKYIDISLKISLYENVMSYM